MLIQMCGKAELDLANGTHITDKAPQLFNPETLTPILFISNTITVRMASLDKGFIHVMKYQVSLGQSPLKCPQTVNGR